MKSLTDVVRGMLTRKFGNEQSVSTHAQPEEQTTQNVASQEIESIIKAMKQSMNEHGVDRRWKLEQHTYHYEIRHGGDHEWVEQLAAVEYRLTDVKTNVVFLCDTEGVLQRTKRTAYGALLDKVECCNDVLEMTEFNPRWYGGYCSISAFTRGQVGDILHHYYLNVFKKDVEHLKALKQQECVDNLKQMYNVQKEK